MYPLSPNLNDLKTAYDNPSIATDKIWEIWNRCSYQEQTSARSLVGIAAPFAGRGDIKSDLYTYFGSHGNVFRFYEPYAEGVNLRIHGWGPISMMSLGHGVFETTQNDVREGMVYHFEVIKDGKTECKTDPYSREGVECRDDGFFIASRIPSSFSFSDGAWMDIRHLYKDTRPMRLLQCHLTTFNECKSWKELGDSLISHCLSQGYSHIQLLGIILHPDKGSLGYHPLSYFAPSIFLDGGLSGFKDFVNRLHGKGIGVIGDLASQTATDSFGLGHMCYETGDHVYGGYKMNISDPYVRSFLISAAKYWLSECHLDGLRIDYVERFVSDPAGHQFLRDLTTVIHREVPSAILIAEDGSTSDCMTHPVESGGFGFDMKWSMGRSLQLLDFMGHPPEERTGIQYLHLISTLKDSLVREKFLFAFSHDEANYASLYSRMFGEHEEKLNALRLVFMLQTLLPFSGSLNFQGNEFGATKKWEGAYSMTPWSEAQEGSHSSLFTFFKNLQHSPPALVDKTVFRWVKDDDTSNSIIAFERGNFLIVLNLGPHSFDTYNLSHARSSPAEQIFASNLLSTSLSPIEGGVALHRFEKQTAVIFQYE
ncbi:MAG: alpha amylase C-terminal domain-containing protein [Simkaniaceae bacterium]|nr:alpha amylase C-terminal domain-containing protein [Simkaniaceae bacterium]